ncbi:MAG: threonyl-tRNA synthetase editing domain-containing protein [Candidatus Heimdallarchaeota archaeon]
MLHIDHFNSSITKRGRRSKLIEDYNPNSKTIKANEALLILASVENQDESFPVSISKKTVDEIAKLAHQLKVNTIVLHPFAHLFADLNSPDIALATLKLTEEGLVRRGFTVTRTPFGWFNTLELRVKGHPLSRVQESSPLT